jgi:hypothetical protein
LWTASPAWTMGIAARGRYAIRTMGIAARGRYAIS